MELFTCPRCGATLAADWVCPACAAAPVLDGGVRDWLEGGDSDRATSEVRDFYEARPFPGYAAGDDASTLIDRARRSSFLVALDAAVGPQARVLDCGCGTGQVAAWLALRGARRHVVGLDGCRASLRAADAFRARVELTNLQLVRGDLFALPLTRGAFDVVHCRGVIHHTERPYEALREVAARVAPGGLLVLGFYESFARAPHAVRRALGRLVGRPIAALDPLLRRRDLDGGKKRTWIEDQYHHPLEHLMPMPRVLAACESEGFEWVCSVPPSERDLLATTPRPGALGRLALRVGWTLHGLADEDAGLVALVLRRHRA
ncbi:MAG TPA: class I SAM-dependent methyltransferase [Planctomycetota bacterium]|nr:class I SAM-dependent methyltransferase [Planctomycetota bacterium]